MKYGILESLHSDADIAVHCYDMKKDWVPTNEEKIHLLISVAKMVGPVYQHIKILLSILKVCSMEMTRSPNILEKI
jgi:hypothetical protein